MSGIVRKNRPARIWVGRVEGLGSWHEGPDFVNDVEYVRADIHRAENECLRAEVEKLVEALQRIDDASNHYCMTPTYSEGTLRYAHKSTRNLARAALEEWGSDK